MKVMKHRLILCVTAIAMFSTQIASSTEQSPRRVISLDGTWRICQANDEQLPPASAFGSTVPVPGLVDMAIPGFTNVGNSRAAGLGSSYWYRRAFTIDGDVPLIAKLKIAKVKYGCSVYLNGQHLDDEARCFTPLYFDVSESLKGNGAENELVVRVGVSRDHPLCKDVLTGQDKEKAKYIPGIYDSVSLILTKGPLQIENVQTAMDPATKALIISPTIVNHGDVSMTHFKAVIREAKTGKVVLERDNVETHQKMSLASKLGQRILPGQKALDLFRVNIDDPRLWSPEDPFLYELELTCSVMSETPGDASMYKMVPSDRMVTRFGMRDFRVDSKTGTPYLNGKPYYLRGTNVCIFRFFEDPDRGDKPWDREWVRRVIRSFKSMNWNSCRYCIGFPPEIWYEVADEEGLLIQDEYPIWALFSWRKNITADKLEPCFRAWMRERWNHPCVAIWDAQNESLTYNVLHDVVARVRGADFSQRPWEFGWEHPMLGTDLTESHPYYFQHAFKSGKKPEGVTEPFEAEMVKKFEDSGRKRVLRVSCPMFRYNKVVNEYGWLWLNRNGKPTSISKTRYEGLLGPDSTEQQRRELYARCLAMQTEKFRSYRWLGVMHFCGLGYCRPSNGATCDNFLELEKLTFDPYFVKYVKDSFAPVGLMIEVWGPTYKPGESFEVPVAAINDLGDEYKGKVRVSLREAEKTLFVEEAEMAIPAYGRGKVTVRLTAPKKEGKYELVAEAMVNGEPVRSYRVVTISR